MDYRYLLCKQTLSNQSQSDGIGVISHSKHKLHTNLNTLVKYEAKVGFKVYVSKTNWMASDKNKNPFPYDIWCTNHTSQHI